jgi:hypothetical protein
MFGLPALSQAVALLLENSSARTALWKGTRAASASVGALATEWTVRHLEDQQRPAAYRSIVAIALESLSTARNPGSQ